MKPKILVLSNDAGASEYIAHMILTEFERANWRVCALPDSPAYKIFTKCNLALTQMASIDCLYDIVKDQRPDLILYGTSWQINFQTAVEEIAEPYHIQSIALLDHWVNYKERFNHHIPPKHIMVMDDIAFALAKKSFGETINILQLKSYFLENMRASFNAVDQKQADSVVFISEPTSIIAKNNLGAEDGYGFTEYSVLEDLLTLFNEITLRLHPSDRSDKYNAIIQNHPNKKITVINPYDEELIETLRKSKLTIGFDGMALFISYYLGINTISYMPTGKRALTIPMPSKYLIDDLNLLSDISFNDDIECELNKNAMTFADAMQNLLGNNVCTL